MTSEVEAPPAPKPAPSVPDALVEAEDLTVEFGSQTALDNISFAIPPGLIVGLIGPSGCGKTTLIRALTGILSPTSGSVRVFGSDPQDFDTRQRMRFGYMPQMPILFPNLSVRANLNFVASLYGMPTFGRRKRLRQLLELVNLDEHRSKKLADCSGGMQRRLALAATLVHDPELLFLDEPTAGVDPILRERFWTHFRSLRDKGVSIIVPTQYVGEAGSCDAVAVMAHGRLIALQPTEKLARIAYDGDPLSVELDGWVSREELARLQALPHVRSVRHSDIGLTVVVEDEAASESVRQQLVSSGASVGEITPLEPSFDEIFFEIIERYDQRAESQS
jgi:ABC-2 type transport system ATP-binding protein